MATLVEKIKSARPKLTSDDFVDSIKVENHGDDRGDFIASWNHPTEKQPTEEELG
jgi:hypothetical protein